MISKLEKFDLLIKDLNDQQRAAVNENKNTVVTSGAGSGKTTVLSYRFLRLVIEEKANVDEILTLTFTRLAASEMFFRIQKNLVAFNEYDEIREQVALFSEATISTIDSFCSQVVGNDLKRYGLSDQYVLDDEANFQLAVECALEVVDKFSDDEGLLFLATMYSPDELIEQLLAKIAVSSFYLNQPYDPLKNTNIIIEKIKDSYTNSIDQLLKQLMSLTAIQGRGKVYLDNLELANNLLNSAPQLLDLSNLEKTFLLLDGVNFKRTTVKDEFAQLFNEIVEEIRKTTLPLVKSCALALIESDKLLPIFQILKEMHSLYLTRKREAQLLTFNDISHMALDILLNNKKIRTYYKNKFKYILVDEFQDTNQLQKDLIYLLAEKKELYSNSIPHPSTLVEDKLFFVGDEKQSIYRFRKADVRVFKKLSSEIESSGGKNLELDLNYRSDPKLINFFNSLFEPIFSSATEDFEATHQELKAGKKESANESKIEFHYKPIDDEQDDDEESSDAIQAEAYHIAKLIEKMVGSDEYLLDDNKRPTYKDIAILQRTTTNQMHFEKALRKEGIPYTISAIRSLFLESVANDIYSFLQLIIYPEDKLAYAAVLRSPFCRLSDELLFPLLENFEVAFENESIETNIDEEQQRYQWAHYVYTKIVELAKTNSISSIVSYLWYEGGYRYYLLSDKSYHPYLEHFDFLYDLALEFDEKKRSLVLFLDFLRERMGQQEHLQDIEPLRDEVDGVRIMTIHKSKGLQFPIVILSGMGGGVRVNQVPPFYTVDSIALPKHYKEDSSKKNILYELDKQSLNAQEVAEMKRLFYVATTRSEKHLILSGFESSRNTGEKAADSYFIALFNNSSYNAIFDKVEIESYPTSILAIGLDYSKIEKNVALMDKNYKATEIPYVVKPFATTVTELAEKSIYETEEVYPLKKVPSDSIIKDKELEAAFGSWCHKAIEKVIKKELTESLDEQKLLEFVPERFKRANITTSQLKEIASSALLLVNNLFKSDFYNELINSGYEKIESEVDFTMRLENEDGPKVVNGSIDLLVHYHSYLKVYDFKSDLFKDKNRHQEQLRLYQEAVTKLYNKEVVTEIIYLRDL
jgi:ATP-dependent exoDNAse (exonuclease V) beta subunit